MSKTRSLHHIVFATKNRKTTINENHKKELYLYIYGIIKNLKCFLIRMNGVEDHIHLLVDIHPTISLSEFVRNVKQSSSKWIKTNPYFADFEGWGEGYYAMSLSMNGVERCKNYIINQETHHASGSLKDELKGMAYENDFGWYEEDLA